MRIPNKKLAALLAIILVSLTGAGFAIVSLTNLNTVGTRVLGTNENAADKVTIYGNGVTFVSYQQSIELGQNTNAFQFYLPYEAFPDTLIVQGINVAKITTSEENHPIIEKGDMITVHTEDSVYHGMFVDWNTMMLLEIDNGTIMIPSDRITKIVLTEVVQTQGPKILIEVTTDSAPGNYTVNVSYLMRGPNWKPTYFVDIETSSLQCRANIQNVENWENFTLTLVSGGPHLVYRGPILTRRNLSASESWTSVAYDEYHEYRYNAKLSFRKGTFVTLPLFNGTVGLQREYFWSGSEVQNRYHINNTLGEPLAAGIAEFYLSEKWLGEDSVPYTPVNGESVVTVNYANDIKVSQIIVQSTHEYRHEFQAINMTIQNHKTSGVQIIICLALSDFTLITSQPSATMIGGTISWIIDVDAGQTVTIYYEWERHW